MNLGMDIPRALDRYYDRILAFALLAALVAAVVALSFQIGTVQRAHREFEQWNKALTPKFAEATNVVLDAFLEAEDRIEKPYQIAGWPRRLSVPELRVACVDCQRPIPYDALVCPVCNAKQSGEVPNDKDEDGMLDEWEVRYGLNPLDPADAQQDEDGDGFSNLEEFLYGTDPTDPKSHPPLIAKLQVLEIKALPFHLKFMAVNRLASGDLYQINSTRSRKTTWVRMGEEVEGYELVRFEFQQVEERPQGSGVPVLVDRSVLYLKSRTTGREVALRKGEEVPISEYEVRLAFEPDRQEYTVRMGGTLQIRGETYTLKEVDFRESRVLLRDSKRDVETWVGRKGSSGGER